MQIGRTVVSFTVRNTTVEKYNLDKASEQTISFSVGKLNQQKTADGKKAEEDIMGSTIECISLLKFKAINHCLCSIGREYNSSSSAVNTF